MSEVFLSDDDYNGSSLMINKSFDKSYLRPNIRELTLYQSINVDSFPDNLPDSIEKLSLGGCVIRLLNVVRYPKNLKKLHVTSCHVREVISVPAGLDKLELGNNEIVDMTRCIARFVDLDRNYIKFINVISSAVETLMMGNNPVEKIVSLAKVASVSIEKIKLLEMDKVPCSYMSLGSAESVTGNSNGRVKYLCTNLTPLPNERPEMVEIRSKEGVRKYVGCEKLSISNVDISIDIIDTSVKCLSLLWNKISSKVLDFSRTNITNLSLNFKYGGKIIFPPAVEKLLVSATEDSYDLSGLKSLKHLIVADGGKTKDIKMILPLGLEYLDVQIGSTFVAELVDSIKIVNMHDGELKSTARPRCIYLEMADEDGDA